MTRIGGGAATRVGLLAGLLMLALGAGAVAQSPSPEATATAEAPNVSPAGEFHASGSLDEPRIGHTATLVADGRVLVVGGIPEAKTEFVDELRPPLPSAEVWDPATGEFTPAGVMSSARVGHTATALPDGRVLVVGGYREEEASEPLASAEVWDPTTGEFTPTGSLSAPRANHTASLLPGGLVLVIGGDRGYDDEFAIRYAHWRAEAWNPATGEFAIVGFLDKPREGHTAAPQGDGRVLVIGGFDGVWDSDTTRERKVVEVWEPTAMNGFGRGGLWDDARWLRTTTVLADGRVLVAGGFADEDGPTDARGYPTEVRVWDPTTQQSSVAGSLIEFRAHHTATLLPDGRVLIVGGGLLTMGAVMAFDTFVLASAEVWDPLTEVSRPAGDLAAPRAGHTATALPDGRVLVVGGVREGSSAGEAEVWEPSRMDDAPTGDTGMDELKAGETPSPTATPAATEGTVETASLPSERRVERAEDGFALTFPLDWHIEIRDKLESREGDPEGTEYRLMLLAWRAPLDAESCSVLDLTPVAHAPPVWTSLDDAAAWMSEWATLQRAAVEPPVHATHPAGSVVTLDERHENGWWATSTVFTDSNHWFVVGCGSKDPPEDRWLPIIESFEFLPPEDE